MYIKGCVCTSFILYTGRARIIMEENQCNICFKVYKEKKNLNRHIRAVHQGIKPHECDLCDKLFSRKQHRDLHRKRCPATVGKITKPSKMQESNRHKSICCFVCNRSMRSDTLKRHLRTHRDFITISGEEGGKELKVRKATPTKRNDKKQKIEENARRESIPFGNCKDVTTQTQQSDINLKDILLKNNEEYLKKLSLGMEIAAVVDEGTIREESLTKEYHKALKLYRKQKSQVDITDAVLRP